MQTEASIDIDRPIDEVFDYTNNHVSEWSRTVIEEEILDEKPGKVGTTFRTVTEDHGRKMEFEGTVVRHDPPGASAVHLEGPQFDIDAEYFFEDLGENRIRITQRATVRAKGFVRVIFFLLG